MRIENGVLKGKYDNLCGNWLWLQLVVPHTLSSEIIDQQHSGCYKATLELTKPLPRLGNSSVCHGCTLLGCQVMGQHLPGLCCKKDSSTAKSRTLHTIKFVYPLQLVVVNILGPLTESGTRNSYILIAATTSQNGRRHTCTLFLTRRQSLLPGSW